MAVYPQTLPGPLVDGYTIAPAEQTIRTDMEVGGARVRRRTYARNDILDVTFAYTGDQFQAFRSWFDSDVDGAAGGSAWFDIELDIGNGGPTMEEARFKGVWRANRDGMLWRVTAQLEVR